MNRSCRLAGVAVAALLLSRPAFAAQQRDLLGTLIIGAANGVVLGIALLIYVWVRKPYRERANAKRAEKEAAKYAAIADALPRIAVLAADGDDEGVARLLDEGADVNACGPSGQTALMLAARNGRTDVVGLLLRRGADPTIKTKTGSTAAEIARTYRRERVEKMIDAEIQLRVQSES